MMLGSFSSYVGPSFGPGRYIEVREERFYRLLRSLLASVVVDEDWYRARYSDVSKAIESGDFATAAEHYARSGYFEDRLPREIAVDEQWYLAAYADVAEAISAGKLKTAQQHFETSGFKEGRLPYESWSL